MRHHKGSPSRPSRKRVNRLINTALFAVVRGAATAAGSALAGLAIWLITRR